MSRLRPLKDTTHSTERDTALTIAGHHGLPLQAVGVLVTQGIGNAGTLQREKDTSETVTGHQSHGGEKVLLTWGEFSV